MSDRITEAAVSAALKVPGPLLAQGAAAVEGAPRWSAQARQNLVQASPAPGYRHHAERMARAWATRPDLPGSTVAAALRSAAAAVASERAEHQVSLVWTGPSTEALGFRTTRAVLQEMVASARHSLLLVSFTSYKIDDLVQRLAQAIDRGVDVSLVFETHADSGGQLSFDAADAFADLQGVASFYHWPKERREAFHSASARLHAKCLVTDRAKALITSANLTSAGINDNIELGTLVEAGPLPGLLNDHFDLLVGGGILERLPR